MAAEFLADRQAQSVHAHNAKAARCKLIADAILGGNYYGPERSLRGLVSDYGTHEPPETGSRIAEKWSPEQDRLDQLAATVRQGSDRRRARLAGAPVIERIDRAAIIERDNSTCYLCGDAVATDDIHLDHVIPLAAGGEHSAANIRVTHARCNLSKGARLLT